jgi:hypothetical protein
MALVTKSKDGSKMDELVLNTAGLIHEDRRLFEAHPKVI